MVRINPRLAILLFLTPIFLALFVIFYVRENRRLLTERYVESGVVALFQGGDVTRDDIQTYFQTPPPEESPILRGLEITPEDVTGLAEEDPAWFEEEQGQLLINRVIKHITLLKYFHGQDDSSIRPALAQEAQAYREALMQKRMESDLDQEKPIVKQEEMLEYYVSHPQEFHRDEMCLARHIMVLEQTGGAEETSPKPEEIERRLRDGEDFQNLIPESESPSRDNGGMLGWLTRGALAAPFEKTLWAMEIGEVTGPVRIGETLHFVQLLDKQKEELLPFKECVEQIRDTLQRQKKQYHRYRVLNLSTETLTQPDPSTSEEYRQALRKAAYERKLDRNPEIAQKTDIFANYRRADLLFNEYMESNGLRPSYPLDSESTGLWLEIESVKKLLKKIEFRLLVKLDLPPTDPIPLDTE